MNFEFNDRFRKQKEGTAMGIKYAPPYAIIFMTALGEEILESLLKKTCLRWRYIDDIFMIWHRGENKLNNLLINLADFILL